MNPKRFWGRDMAEALRAVRGALGADALISETKNLPKDQGGGIEITALTDGAAAQPEVSAEPVPFALYSAAAPRQNGAVGYNEKDAAATGIVAKQAYRLIESLIEGRPTWTEI